MNLSLGTLYAWSIFVAPLEKEFGWKRADVSFVFSIVVFVFALSFVVAGRIQDKKGPFWVSVTGGVLVSLGFFMCAYTTSQAWLFFWFGVVAGLGNGFGYATPIPVMAKWFPDKRGTAVGLAVAGFGGGSAIFGPLGNSFIGSYGWRAAFQILGCIFLVMTIIAAFLLKNPPVGYKPAGWVPAPAAKSAATGHEFTPGETLKTPAFYFMWLAYFLGCFAGLMVISQLVPFAKTMGFSGTEFAFYVFLVTAAGSALGRIFSGTLSDAIGRLNVLRLMIAVSAVSMPLMYLAGGNLVTLLAMAFIVYWCYGTQLSVNASTASDFWGTKNAGINYGMLFTAWGMAGLLGGRFGGAMFDRYKDYRVAFYTAGVLSVVALIAEFLAKRPPIPAKAEAAKAPAT
ncbi:MAG TPA: OFA family MFS transporter [Anaeromyxobacteraceae bacterium]|nr:OFA family MFS transporter [Anaeromyxobacteraceae bacterium]